MSPLSSDSLPPNILWIVLDTHRYDRLGCYGYTRGASPNLDAFAAQATVFEHAVAPAQWTVPAHASMFTGEFPTTHQTTQSGDMLDGYFRTAAEWLRSAGYQSAGFCNNPLVGVLNNGFKRGFDVFYNYGGAVPSTPAHALYRPVSLLGQVWERYTQLLRRISYPVQNAIAQSHSLLQLSLVPAFVPLWTRFAHFKGDTRRSIEDTLGYINKHMAPGGRQAQFVFLNLLQTHLPFTPPEAFIGKFAPLLRDERAARDFMAVYNTQALRWLLPMDEPFSDLEFTALSQMYDAEVAYQDHLLGRLLETLDQPYHRDNTAVIIVADHGEMLGEHHLVGHSFGVYEELVRVPLIMRLPGQAGGRRVSQPVSTARLFHTVLDLGRVDEPGVFEQLGLQVAEHSLVGAARSARLRPGPAVISEAFPPQNVLRMVEKDSEGLLQAYACRSVQRAAYSPALHKLIEIEDHPAQLYDLPGDPSELHDLLPDAPAPLLEARRSLSQELENFLRHAQLRQPQNWTRQQVQIDDPHVLQRLQQLGYIDLPIEPPSRGPRR
ncbi:MAG: sulfatase [Chloroflexota bacterium]